MNRPDPIAPESCSRLAELKIERDVPVTPSRRPLSPLVLMIAAVMGAGAGVLTFRGEGEAGPRATAEPPVRSAASTEVDLEPTQPQVTGAGRQSILDATGYVVARRQATVSAKTTGKVLEILMEEGMAVAAGQVIARLDDDVTQAELALTQAQLGAARAALSGLEMQREHAGRMLNRTRTLAARDLASEIDLDQQRLSYDVLDARLEQAGREVQVAEAQVTVQRRRLADFTVRAPFAGVVVDKAAQPGEMVSPLSAGGGFTRTGLGTIVDMDSLEVEVDVNEAYINRVHAGQAVTVTLNAYPDHSYPAEVVTVVPTADRTRATVTVRVALRNVDDRVLPEMGVRVAFLASDANQHSEEGP